MSFTYVGKCEGGPCHGDVISHYSRLYFIRDRADVRKVLGSYIYNPALGNEPASWQWRDS